MEILRTADTNASASSAIDEVSNLSPEQEAALRSAVEHGYYESPRKVDVSELAEHLDVPRSTLTYRLRRAEEHLAKEHVAHSQVTQEQSTSL